MEFGLQKTIPIMGVWVIVVHMDLLNFSIGKDCSSVPVSGWVLCHGHAGAVKTATISLEFLRTCLRKYSEPTSPGSGT